MRELIETTWATVACDVCEAQPSEHRILGTRSARIIQKKHDYTWCHEDVQCRRCGFHAA